MNYEETLEYLSYLIGEDKYYVYCLSDPDTLKPLYIGKGRSYRILRHSTRNTDGQVTNNRLSGKRKSLKDQGKDFDFSILADSTNESVIYILETVYIRKYGLAMRGGTLLNFTYGGLLNEYNSYYGIDFYKEAKALRQDEGAKYFGHTVYLNGFIFPSYKQAVRSTKARRSVTALQKSINNGALKDACELNHNDLEKAKSFDHAISEMYAKYQREQEGLVASYNNANPENPIVVSDYRRGNPRYAYYKRLEEEDKIIHTDRKIYVDFLHFWSYKYASQYLGITPSYVRTLINKRKPGYFKFTN